MATADPLYDPTVASAAIVTIGSGLTLSGAGALTNDLLTGKAGGQTVIGGTAASENLTLSSTSHVTKGKVVVSDNLVIAAGTLASNAIQHASNAGTGIYFASTTQGVFASNGSVAGSWTNTFFNLQRSLQIQGGIVMSDANDLSTGTTTGTKFGTATSQKLAFFNATPVVQQTRGATLTNNATVGGTTDQIDDFAGAVYATDAATIRNDIYQLARALRLHDVALRALGLES